MFAVVDYRMGNLKSVERGLRSVGADARITSDAREIAAADAVVLPGVGAFADAASSMESLGQMDAIRSALADGKPFLGICLGQHLLFEEGVEGAPEGSTAKGLGVLPGTVVRMPNCDEAGVRYKIPHVGWNSIEAPLGMGVGKSQLKTVCYLPDSEKGEGPAACGRALAGNVASAPGAAEVSSLFSGIAQGEHFYFTHSYIAPDSSCTIAETMHSVRFPSAIAVSDRIFGVQFHPEKSSDAGAKLLANFVTIASACSR